jgi:hypothetical protein
MVRRVTFRQFLQAALIAHPHPFVRDFAYDSVELPLDPNFPWKATSYAHLKNYMLNSGAGRNALLGAALAWRFYRHVRNDVVSR